ncbi:VOC family protein [Luteibacter aegosomaticola]|uniref:VOC family protein n=1 Tax=Luteibacter aegosomaticola TaxID=2911538 RepID=UPI001FFB606B|nr:VOC family protein [Luteibacter aegosomaticola]UPG92167.1 VOC family protein [Luteibacter aegosomaticola]
MRFGYTILYVPDVAATVGFYEQAIGLTRRFIHESGMYAEMETGGTVLAFAHLSMAEANGLQVTPPNAAQPAPPVEICFVADDPELAFEHAVKHGAALVRPVEEKPWGQKVGHLRDLNGFVIEICSAM